MLHAQIQANPEDAEIARGRRRRWGLLALAAGLATLLFIALRSLFGTDARADAPPPIPAVTVSRPLSQSILEWDDYVGRFEASQAVEIKPRVSGALESIHFRDGDIVRKGQLLFVIDPRPFAAALAEARARQGSAETALALARTEMARADRLIAAEAISQEEVDSARAAVRSAAAAVEAARAQVQARALDMEFTRVRAPVTGRISDRRVDVGNLVSANQSMLTTVLALDPIYFSFDGSEALYLKSQRDKDRQGAPQEAEIRLQDETAYSWKGKVDFTDNAIDQGSGTVRGRAVVSNPDYFLTPGMFGNMRLASGASRPALLVPDAAIQTDQARKVVYVVGKDDLITVKPVEIGPRVGTLRAIRSGLAAGDRVVVSGVQYAAPGAKVQARETPITAPGKEPAERSYSAPAASQATLAAAS
ncbi:efflux transporter periplasmic adaptor subunit [Sphingomonas oleivorans]|uniref:Efflux transporter periplasmic adaptor subunit n=1 Tax=Sphingomonas oleivorans TaxID=1735121 RepID=A0A2T5FW29_9SPHN|nr:efflux RND transporter periplasmic adaptor subunit [Sphingomonas oleivorans]PTQ09982.1 efflux transporter periplasmic adaptor subunit [Sphingomonas oleivorans]